MTANPPRVVFDAVLFIQTLISGRGPARACVDRVRSGRAILYLSPPILEEISDVPLRPELTRRYHQLTPERLMVFVQEITAIAVLVPNPPHALSLPRDHNDEPYINLAAAVDAAYLVTWNERHLTYLMRGDTPEGAEFRRRFPNLQIVAPPTFLQHVGRAD